MLRKAFASKRVLITGHTGFKGSWLSEWLLCLGADVTGFSLPPPTDPALFDQISLAKRLRHIIGDIRDPSALQTLVRETKPDFIFHLAAQPLVRRSYAQPVETYSTNVMGTVNVLEAVRQADAECTVVIATTDKCYENLERDHNYSESDPLGGCDPYSSSKACAELVAGAYRSSYFKKNLRHIAVATARAGNVLGGGDWAADRILPDCVRSLQAGRPISVRNPGAIRPWQHVLESLSGYLVLAAQLSTARSAADDARLQQLAGPFNFGPDAAAQRSVAELVNTVLTYWPGEWKDHSSPSAPHEAHRLQLAVEKAAQLIDWRPVWGFDETIRHTLEWYRACAAPHSTESLAAMTRSQILQYERDAAAARLPWIV